MHRGHFHLRGVGTRMAFISQASARMGKARCTFERTITDWARPNDLRDLQSKAEEGMGGVHAGSLSPNQLRRSGVG